LFGGAPGKVLDIDKRLLLEKGSDFETLTVAVDPPVYGNLTTWSMNNQKSNMSRGNQPKLARILGGNVQGGRKHSEMVSGIEEFWSGSIFMFVFVHHSNCLLWLCIDGLRIVVHR
jgi:hypothetical protein